jgi:hypothetical protein
MTSTEERSIEDYKNFTKKLKSKVRFLQQKNEELVVKIAEIKALKDK